MIKIVYEQQHGNYSSPRNKIKYPSMYGIWQSEV